MGRRPLPNSESLGQQPGLSLLKLVRCYPSVDVRAIAGAVEGASAMCALLRALSKEGGSEGSARTKADIEGFGALRLKEVGLPREAGKRRRGFLAMKEIKLLGPRQSAEGPPTSRRDSAMLASQR